MTADKITIANLARLASALNDASAEVAYFARIAEAGEISPEQAATEINRIAERIEKAANP